MITKNEFMKKLKEARASQLLIERRMNEIFSNYNLDAMPFSASNSDNLRDAIHCYVQYGEMPLSENLNDFWKSYKKFVQNEKE